MKNKTEMDSRTKAIRDLHEKLVDVDMERDALRRQEHTLSIKSKDIRSEIFFLMTGKRFGEIFKWNNKDYEIISETTIWITTGSLRQSYAPHLDLFLIGQATSPIKG